MKKNKFDSSQLKIVIVVLIVACAFVAGIRVSGLVQSRQNTKSSFETSEIALGGANEQITSTANEPNALDTSNSRTTQQPTASPTPTPDPVPTPIATNPNDADPSPVPITLYEEVIAKCQNYDSRIELPMESEMLDEPYMMYVKSSKGGGIYLCWNNGGTEVITTLYDHTPLTLYAIRGSRAIAETNEGKIGWVRLDRLSETNNW